MDEMVEATTSENPVATEPAAVDQTVTTPAVGFAEDAEGLGAKNVDDQAQSVEYSFENLATSDDVEIDRPTAEHFAEVAKEVGLNQENFEKVYTKVMPYLAQRQNEQMSELRHEFISQIKNDPELGGANYQRTISTARQAFNKLVDTETMEVLHASGLDCHPGLIRTFYNVARMISDDAVVRGGASQKRDAAKSFFPNSNMN